MKPKSRRSFWSAMFEDWKPILLIALPIFAFALWYATRHGYTDLFLYIVVIALASWHVAAMAVLAWRKLMAYRKQNEESHLPQNLSRLESRRDDPPTSR